ncbi:MAG TPA: hypothetical protein VF266_08495 [Thermoanaerobaculia bacterium]
MEGRVLLNCGECELTRQIAGEIPDEYIRSFADAVQQDGWVPKPGANTAELICRDCLMKYAGHETVDDEEKVQGRKNPMEP